tara:strand:- start:239 stop:454 length:216 start_codon:yes stop_codon:yes gene_type:complete
MNNSTLETRKILMLDKLMKKKTNQLQKLRKQLKYWKKQKYSTFMVNDTINNIKKCNIVIKKINKLRFDILV